MRIVKFQVKNNKNKNNHKAKRFGINNFQIF